MLKIEPLIRWKNYDAHIRGIEAIFCTNHRPRMIFSRLKFLRVFSEKRLKLELVYEMYKKIEDLISFSNVISIKKKSWL